MKKLGLRMKLCGKSRGEWFDLATRKKDGGTIYAFHVSDQTSGKWLLNVRVSSSGEKSVVFAATSQKTGIVHNQIKRKSIVFNACSCGEHFYHPLGISYLEGERLRSKRVEKLDDVPEEILETFEIKKHEDVSPKSSTQLKEKLVALVEKNDVKKMALLFILEKICPIFKAATRRVTT